MDQKNVRLLKGLGFITGGWFVGFILYAAISAIADLASNAILIPGLFTIGFIIQLVVFIICWFKTKDLPIESDKFKKDRKHFHIIGILLTALAAAACIVVIVLVFIVNHSGGEIGLMLSAVLELLALLAGQFLGYGSYKK